jgi:hypothetical protein
MLKLVSPAAGVSPSEVYLEKSNQQLFASGETSSKKSEVAYGVALLKFIVSFVGLALDTGTESGRPLVFEPRSIASFEVTM